MLMMHINCVYVSHINFRRTRGKYIKSLCRFVTSLRLKILYGLIFVCGGVFNASFHIYFSASGERPLYVILLIAGTIIGLTLYVVFFISMSIFKSRLVGVYVRLALNKKIISSMVLILLFCTVPTATLSEYGCLYVVLIGRPLLFYVMNLVVCIMMVVLTLSIIMVPFSYKNSRYNILLGGRVIYVPIAPVTLFMYPA